MSAQEAPGPAPNEPTEPPKIVVADIVNFAEFKFAELLSRADQIIAALEAAKKIPVEELDEDRAANIVTLIKQAHLSETPLADTGRACETPYKDAGAKVKAVFAGRGETIKDLRGQVLERVHAWMKAEKKDRVEGELGVKTVISRRTVYEVTNPALVPEGYLVPDMASINKAMKQGKTIPGVEAVTKINISVS